MRGPRSLALSGARVLIVEDDSHLRLALEDNLLLEGCAVVCAADASSASRLIDAHTFDLVILDIMLPDGDGYSLCRTLRARGSDAMVLILTARSLEDDVVRGFEAGADDYLAKPYRLRELLARAAALLRRRAPQSDTIELSDFGIDRRARKVRDHSGQEIDLTRKEFDLLCCLIDRHGCALTRREILDEVWGRGISVDNRTVDNFISNLRRKLGWNPTSGYRIHAIRGVGYRLEIDAEPSGNGPAGY